MTTLDHLSGGRIDELPRTIDAVGGDRFAIRQRIWPDYVGPFVDKVIPLR